MSDAIIVGLLSLVGTIIGSIFGILAANKLVVYRLEQLEKKVDKHNGLIERMAVAEANIKSDEEILGDLALRINKLEVQK